MSLNSKVQEAYARISESLLSHNYTTRIVELSSDGGRLVVLCERGQCLVAFCCPLPSMLCCPFNRWYLKLWCAADNSVCFELGKTEAHLLLNCCIGGLLGLYLQERSFVSCREAIRVALTSGLRQAPTRVVPFSYTSQHYVQQNHAMNHGISVQSMQQPTQTIHEPSVMQNALYVDATSAVLVQQPNMPPPPSYDWSVPMAVAVVDESQAFQSLPTYTSYELGTWAQQAK